MRSLPVIATERASGRDIDVIDDNTPVNVANTEGERNGTLSLALDWSFTALIGFLVVSYWRVSTSCKQQQRLPFLSLHCDLHALATYRTRIDSLVR